MSPIILDDLNIPNYNPFIPQVSGSEASFTKYINGELEKRGYSIRNQVTVQKDAKTIFIDIIADQSLEKKYIEVKWLRNFHKVVMAIGQILWYSHLLGKPVFLALWCGFYSGLLKTEIEFIEKHNIPLLLVSPKELKFFETHKKNFLGHKI